MFKNRFLLVLSVISLFLVTMAVSNPQSNPSLAADQTASDFHQRHPEWTWTRRSVPDLTDYANRHPELGVSSKDTLAASDYFQRHPELVARAEFSADLTDYFFRLPAAGSTIDLTDYFFRQR